MPIQLCFNECALQSTLGIPSQIPINMSIYVTKCIEYTYVNTFFPECVAKGSCFLGRRSGVSECLRPVSSHVSKFRAIALSMGNVREDYASSCAIACRVARVVLCGLQHVAMHVSRVAAIALSMENLTKVVVFQVVQVHFAWLSWYFVASCGVQSAKCGV